MFPENLQQVQDEISTIRSIIKTNENLRTTLLSKKSIEGQQSEDYTKLLKLLQKDLPKTKEWRIYDHCSSVTKLYAIYENFVENLITDWLRLLPGIVLNYDDLEKEICNTHSYGVGRLLREKDKKRYKHLSIQKIISGLYLGINQAEKYELLPEAFLFHEQNLRKNILEELLLNAGISNSWTWINRHKSTKLFIEEIRGGQNTLEGELKQLISYRNDAAHGVLIDEFLGFDALLELCDFVDSICQSLADLFTSKVIQKKEINSQARKIGKITEWLNEPQAGIATIADASLAINSNLFLVNENIAYCQSAIIQSIQIEGESVTEVEATEEREVGLKFDINANKGLDLYLLL